MAEKWFGFTCRKFIFEEHEALIVFPEDGASNGYLAVKTEYWDAFPEAAEIELVKNGFHLCFIKNDNVWARESDIDRKARFIRFVQAEYCLKQKCVLIGMSCGGLYAITLAARYPELIQCMYIDAPVVNFLSCPCGLGAAKPISEEALSRFLSIMGTSSVSQLLACRDMPLDKLSILTANNIPIVLVSGDSDTVVPFEENGLLVQKAYKDAGTEIAVYIKPGCDHHPHGLPDSTPIVTFILEHCV